MEPAIFTPSGVRLRRRRQGPGELNWLLLPGGPGIGSESLHELADALEVAGGIWMVDLPGDGSNRGALGAGSDPFARWPGVVVEAAQALPNVVFAGHSTGGMYLLATPELERHVLGLALLDTAPDCSWHRRFVAMTGRHPLPAVEAATAVYEADRRDENIAAIAGRPGTSRRRRSRPVASCWRGCRTTPPPWTGRTPTSTTPIARPGGLRSCRL